MSSRYREAIYLESLLGRADSPFVLDEELQLLHHVLGQHLPLMCLAFVMNDNPHCAWVHLRFYHFLALTWTLGPVLQCQPCLFLYVVTAV